MIGKIFTKILYKVPDSLSESAKNTFLGDLVVRAIIAIEPSQVETYRLPSKDEEFNLFFTSKHSAYEKEIIEPNLVEELTNLLDENTVFYDLGSHLGYFSKLAQHLNVKDENIHAFDVNLYDCKLTEINCGKGIRIVNKFVSDETTSKSIRLDDYAKEHASPDIVKMDVEGAELKVLKGMDQILDTKRPLLLIELHPSDLLKKFDSTAKEIFDFLESKDYELRIKNQTEENSWKEVSNREKTNSYLMKATPC